MKYRLSVAIVALAGLLIAQGCGPNMAEQFKMAQEKGTLDALDEFVAANPDHPYDDEVSDLREQIRFREATAEGTVEALETFLKDYPESESKDDAMAALDEARWAKASEEKSVKAYRAYLDDHPDGKHAEEATKAVEEALFEKAKKSVSKLRKFLRKKGRSTEMKAKGYALLKEKVEEDTKDKGLIAFPKEKDGKLLGYSWLEGYKGGELLAIDAKKVKTPKKLQWKVRRKKVKSPTLRGKVELEVKGEFDDEPIHLVALVKPKDKRTARTGEQLLELKTKRLVKKGKGNARVKLSWEAVPKVGGESEIYLFLVKGEVPSKYQKMKPVSNIVLLGETEVVIPDAE